MNTETNRAVDALREAPPASPLILLIPAGLLLICGAVYSIPALQSAESFASVVAGLSAFLLLMGWRAAIPAPSNPVVTVVLIGRLRRNIEEVQRQLDESKAEVEKLRRTGL